MNDDHVVTIEEEINTIRMGKPHVVVLGAGASRATCPNGDRNRKPLPLMKDFVQVVELKYLLGKWGVNIERNFEEIFNDLYERGETEKVEEIQKIVEEYFDQLQLPDKPTIYDHLVLSLRDTDLIATFNWDPLLIHAFLRNRKAGLSLPKLAFLHGNIRTGYCEEDRISSLVGMRCRKCGNWYKKTPLLYPIKKKDYAKDSFIENEWKMLKRGFENAFMITIFGYSGPKTDKEAIEAMRKAWGDINKREMEQTAFITTQNEDEVSQNWKQFIHTHHYEIDKDFYDSWIANHPRRTGEAYLSQYFDAKFIDKNPIPKELDFPELWKWFSQFKSTEQSK